MANRDENDGVSADRRRLLQGLGGAAFGCAAVDTRSATDSQAAAPGADAPPPVVAGVRIVDSGIARAATELSRSASPAYLFNHALRTFVFASLIGRAGAKPFDEELLYLACVMHDLGLTGPFAGDLPFEIQGAEAAKGFLQTQGYPGHGTEVVWDGIAMHASALARFKRPEIALVAEGAGADVLGPDFSQITRADAEAVVRAFPRLGFKQAFVQTCAGVIRKHPGGAGRSFMRDIGERFVPGFRPPNFCDLLERAPFDD
jgi:hypothetical protein